MRATQTSHKLHRMKQMRSQYMPKNRQLYTFGGQSNIKQVLKSDRPFSSQGQPVDKQIPTGERKQSRNNLELKGQGFEKKFYSTGGTEAFLSMDDRAFNNPSMKTTKKNDVLDQYLQNAQPCGIMMNHKQIFNQRRAHIETQSQQFKQERNGEGIAQSRVYTPSLEVGSQRIPSSYGQKLKQKEDSRSQQVNTPSHKHSRQNTNLESPIKTAAPNEPTKTIDSKPISRSDFRLRTSKNSKSLTMPNLH